MWRPLECTARGLSLSPPVISIQFGGLLRTGNHRRPVTAEKTEGSRSQHLLTTNNRDVGTCSKEVSHRFAARVSNRLLSTLSPRSLASDDLLTASCAYYTPSKPPNPYCKKIILVRTERKINNARVTMTRFRNMVRYNSNNFMSSMGPRIMKAI